MGCDYYTWIETVIEWIDASGNFNTFIDKPDFEQYNRHYDGYRADYDPDVEDPPKTNLEIEIENYGEIVLFENGTWLCKEAGKRRILQILNDNHIPIEGLRKVFKRMDGYHR